MPSWHCCWPKVCQISARAPSQSKTKAVCSQHNKHTTAGPFHFLHMGPLSNVTMCYFFQHKAVCGEGTGVALAFMNKYDCQVYGDCSDVEEVGMEPVLPVGGWMASKLR